MHKFLRNLITEWRKLELPFHEEKVILAVSGGADSVSLLLAIEELLRRKKLTIELVVAHFNHRLRGKESETDERFVRELAKGLNVEFISGSARSKTTRNVEQKARDDRYKFLSRVARRHKSKLVITAHTVNDQAETFLLNLIRGSGPDGLSAMRPVRELERGIMLARPLLTWATRNETEQYCRDRDTEFRIDHMNKDERFTRVRIRRTILPALAEINPKIVQTLARTSELMRVQSDSNAETQHFPVGDELKISKLRSLPAPDLYAALRKWLLRRRGSLRGIQLKHIEAIKRLIASTKSGKTVELPGGGRVIKEKGALFLRNIKVEK